MTSSVIEEAQTDKDGPQDVYFNKMYKPVFICWVDVVTAITFLISSSIYFTYELQEDIPIKFEFKKDIESANRIGSKFGSNELEK